MDTKGKPLSKELIKLLTDSYKSKSVTLLKTNQHDEK